MLRNVRNLVVGVKEVVERDVQCSGSVLYAFKTARVLGSGRCREEVVTVSSTRGIGLRHGEGLLVLDSRPGTLPNDVSDGETATHRSLGGGVEVIAVVRCNPWDER